MSQLHLSFIIAVVVVTSQAVDAKRGCSKFGHSCYGGHGKRSGASSPEQDISDEMIQQASGQTSYGMPAQEFIPVRDGGVNYNRDVSIENNKVRDMVLKKMIDYMNARRNNEEGMF